MNKAELIAAVAAETELSKKDSALALEAIIGAIKDSLKKGDKVAIVGFGSFEAKKRAARKGHNPATGKEIKIAASVAPTFKAGKAFKDALN